MAFGCSADTTIDNVDCREGLWVNPSVSTYTILTYTVPQSIIESSGDGVMLYNGVKLPIIPEWDKETYPYYFITWNYINYGSSVGYYGQVVATDTPHYKQELSDSTTIVGKQKRCVFNTCTSASISALFGYPVNMWSEAEYFETGSDTFSDVYYLLREIVWTSYDNEKIREIANSTENVFLIDLTIYSDCYGDIYGYGHHLTALGYRKMASEISAYISYIISQNLEDFKFVQFANTSFTP